MKFPDSREMRQAKSAGQSVRFGSQTSAAVVYRRTQKCFFQRLDSSNLKDRSHRRERKASWAVGTKGVCGGAEPGGVGFPKGGELGAADTAVLREPTQARPQRSRDGAQTAAQGEAGATSSRGGVRTEPCAVSGRVLLEAGARGLALEGGRGRASGEESPGGPARALAQARARRWRARPPSGGAAAATEPAMVVGGGRVSR